VADEAEPAFEELLAPVAKDVPELFERALVVGVEADRALEVVELVERDGRTRDLGGAVRVSSGHLEPPQGRSARTRLH